jgi:hypothetical protein
MLKRITNITNKESLTTKLTLIIVGLTAGSALLVPATYASFHPVTSGEIADETIRSVDIRNGEVTTGDIGTGAVRSGDILDDQVYSVDIRNSQIASVDIANGQVAAVDIQNGAIQPNIQQKSAQETIERNTDEDISLDCPAGTILTGGGYTVSNTLVDVYRNLPVDSNTWEVSGANTSPSLDFFLNAYVVCIGPMG